MMFFLGTTITSTIIITDRLEGVWDRSIVAGVTSMEILITHFLLQMFLIFLQMIEIVVITFGFYGLEYMGSIFAIVVIVALQGLCGMSYGKWKFLNFEICEFDRKDCNLATPQQNLKCTAFLP